MMTSNRPLGVAMSGDSPEQPESLPNSHLEFFFPSVISNPHHDVPAQLTRPTREFLSFASPRCDRAEKFIELLVQRRAVRDPLPTAPRANEPAAALDCPDLYLIALHNTARAELASSFLPLAAERNLRLLFLTDSTDSANNLIEVLQKQTSEAIGKALATYEGLDELCPQVARTTASSIAEQEYVDYLKQLDAQIEAIEKTETLRSEIQKSEAQREAVRQEIKVFISCRSECTTYREELTRAMEQKLNLAKKLEEVQQESLVAPVGFFKKLFGGKAEPDVQLVRQIAEAESQLRAAEQNHAELAAQEQSTREKLHLLEENGGLAKLEERLETLNRQHAQLEEQLRYAPHGGAGCECCATELNGLHTKKQDFLARPRHASREKLNAVKVVVGVLDAIGHDPFLIASHPEAEPIFDKLIYLNGEAVSEVDFLGTARLAHSWIVVAGEDSLQTLKPYRNGKPLPQGTFFEWTWAALDTRPFIRLNGKWIARLQSIPVEFAATETIELLADRTEIELHFFENDQLELAEIHFPGTMTLPEVKAFLASELGEARFAVNGEAQWHASEREIVCCWPAIETTTDTRIEVPLADGICEWLNNTEPHAKTARVAFACSEGWTLEAAQAWLATRTHTSVRNAIC